MFSEKRIEVIKLRKKGFTQEEIAKKLKIKQSTVSNHITSFYKNLRKANKALKIAKELGIDIKDEF